MLLGLVGFKVGSHSLQQSWESFFIKIEFALNAWFCFKIFFFSKSLCSDTRWSNKVLICS